ncbi:MAG: hypothetical protein ABFR89_10255 [Actinomycetota bacterium]
MHWLQLALQVVEGDPTQERGPEVADYSQIPGLVAVTAVLVLAVVLVIMWTRKKPGRRYDRKPPGQAEGGLDDWGGRG